MSVGNYIRFNFEDFCVRNGLDHEGLTAIIDKLPKSNGVWLGGGALRRTLIKQPLDSDFDYFFSNADQLADWQAKLPKTLRKIRETEHHIHYRGTLKGSDLPVDIQAIKFSFYENAEAVIESFDYTITQFALCGDDLVTSPLALWDLGRKRLAIHKVTYPVATMRRMLKYTKQGFTACGGCMSTLIKGTASNPDAMAHLDIEYVD